MSRMHAIVHAAAHDLSTRHHPPLHPAISGASRSSYRASRSYISAPLTPRFRVV